MVDFMDGKNCVADGLELLLKMLKTLKALSIKAMGAISDHREHKMASKHRVQKAINYWDFNFRTLLVCQFSDCRWILSWKGPPHKIYGGRIKKG